MGVRIEITGDADVKTLDDVEPYVLCVDDDGDPCWKDDCGNVFIQGAHGGPHLSRWHPSDAKVARVIGPFRIVID